MITIIIMIPGEALYPGPSILGDDYNNNNDTWRSSVYQAQYPGKYYSLFPTEYCHQIPVDY